MTTYKVRVEWVHNAGYASSTYKTEATVDAPNRDMAVARAMRRPANKTGSEWHLAHVECTEITREEAA